MDNIFGTYNSLIDYQKTVGKSYAAFQRKGHRYVGGGNSAFTYYAKKSVIQEGFPVNLNELTRVATLHLSYEVYENALISATSIKVKKNLSGGIVYVGEKLMAAPSTVAGTGTGFTISAIDRTNALYDVLTVSAIPAALTAGDILVESSASGAGATIKVIPNGLVRDDIYLDEYATNFTVDVLYEGEVYSRRIPPMNAAIKALMPQIMFNNSK